MTTNTTDGGAASAHFVCTVAEFMAATPKERLLLVQRQIHLTPERWNQADWVMGGVFDTEDVFELDVDNPHLVTVNCGARMCIAGWTAVLAGRPWVDDTKLVSEQGDVLPAETYAQALLDLTDMEVQELFYGFQGSGKSPADLAELDDIIERYTA